MWELVVGALIALVGTVVASSAVGEWLRRRDLRESIKGDLDIWTRLPDESDAKAGLLRRIDQRLDSLGAQRGVRPQLLSSFTFFVMGRHVCHDAQRHAYQRWREGFPTRWRRSPALLQGGRYLSSFQSFVLITALVLLGTAIYGFFALIITTWLGEKASRRNRRSPQPSPSAQTGEPPSDQQQEQ